MYTSRDIPEAIKLELRREVHWGCPVHGCGSPFLSYHHFDPPFSCFKPGQTHDSKGMIALCLAHAKMADSGVWTNNQLQQMKTSPYLASGHIKGRLEWLRQDIIVCFGSIKCIKTNIILEVNNKPYIWVNRDPQGNMLLSMDIPSKTGDSIIKMEANDWHVFGDIANLEAVPGGRSIEVRIPNESFSLQMHFRDLTQFEVQADIEAKSIKRFEQTQQRRLDEYKSLPPELVKILSANRPPPQEELESIKQFDWEPYRTNISAWPALEITLTGQLPAATPIQLTPKATYLFGGIFSDALFVGGHSAISIS